MLYINLHNTYKVGLASLKPMTFGGHCIRRMKSAELGTCGFLFKRSSSFSQRSSSIMKTRQMPSSVDVDCREEGPSGLQASSASLTHLQMKQISQFLIQPD